MVLGSERHRSCWGSPLHHLLPLVRPWWRGAQGRWGNALHSQAHPLLAGASWHLIYLFSKCSLITWGQRLGIQMWKRPTVVRKHEQSQEGELFPPQRSTPGPSPS